MAKIEECGPLGQVQKQGAKCIHAGATPHKSFLQSPTGTEPQGPDYKQTESDLFVYNLELQCGHSFK